MIHAAMRGEDRFSVCEFSTMTASFEGDLEACKLGGAKGIGICEAKLPAGGDAAAREKFRASGLKASVCLPAVLSILPLPQFAGPGEPEQRVQALIAGIRRLARLRYDLEVLSDNSMFGNNYPESLWQLRPSSL